MIVSLPLLLALPQALQAPASRPYDRVIELEITDDEPHLVDGWGPTVVVEHEVEFEGVLLVWTESEHDLFLRVDDALEARTIASDDDSGGGKTPYLELPVQEGDLLAVFVAGQEASPGTRLHLIGTPETEAMRAAIVILREADRDALELARDGKPEEGRGRVRTALAKTDGVDSDHPDLTWARANLAVSMAEMGDLAGAHALLEELLASYERTLPADHREFVRAREGAAIYRYETGDVAGARALEEEVLAVRERTLPADDPRLSRAREILAASMAAMGDLAGARALGEAVLAACERTLPADHPDLLRARQNLAVSMAEMGDVAGARALEEVVLAACERTLPEGHTDLLWARQNLAVSMREMGDTAGARALEEAVLAARERTLPEGHPDLVRARQNLGVTLRQMGDRAGARALFEQVLAAREETLPGDHPDLLAARQNVAVSMLEMGDVAGARALQEEVLAARERRWREGDPDVLAARGNLAVLMVAMGDRVAARALLPAQCRGMTKRVMEALAFAPRQAIATVAAESYRLPMLLFLSEPESGGTDTAFELTETLRLVAGEAARSLAGRDEDAELAPILAEASRVRGELNDLVAGAVRGESSDDVAAELTRLSLERDRLEREASRRLAERGVAVEPVQSDALAAALGEGDVAVGYRRVGRWGKDEANGRYETGADEILAHVLTSDGRLTRVSLGLAAELEGLASAWRAELGAPLLRGVAPDEDGSRGELQAGLELRERVLDPVLAAAGEGARRLFVCSDDLLFLVPLDALPLRDEPGAGEGVRVGDRFEVVNEVSFARLLGPASGDRQGEGEPSLLVLGGVDYDADGVVPRGLVAAAAPIDVAAADAATPAEAAPDEGATRSALPDRFRRLLQTRFEAESAGALFEMGFEAEPSVLEGKATTKAALFAAAPGKRYVHLATHGWFAPESIKSIVDGRPGDSLRMGLEERVSGLAPMTLCGLALAGANRGRDSLGRVAGILTAEELCSLDLSQCDLAVLSACETNVGIRRAGQGIQSLQAALYAAGARSSITSLWKVDDAATRKLMELFYTNLWVEKTGKADALWQAKVAMREAGHPVRDWAGWVLTGDPE